MKNKIFISGKITGEHIYECTGKFLKAEIEVIRLGFDKPINPLEIDGIHFGISHDKAMELCLNKLKTCTHIYMLKDWEESEGAKIEHQYAKENNIEIIYQKMQRVYE